MSTCNRLDLQTLGSQPIMPKNLPGHYPMQTQVHFVQTFTKLELAHLVLFLSSKP